MSTVSVGILIPSLGGPQLDQCLAAVARLDPPPDALLVVLSGARSSEMPGLGEGAASNTEYLRLPQRLGFAAAVNAGIQALPRSLDSIALLNDDAMPDPCWLRVLVGALEQEPELAAVQGTVTDAQGTRIDGRGISLDRFGLAVQVDRGQACDASDREPAGFRPLLAVSGTAALLGRQALDQVRLPDRPRGVLDETFGSYYEDLDLGLRLGRLGWRSAWISGALCRHLGSLTGQRMHWRHPWWLLANRWRALAGNLTPAALLRLGPRLLRGELRALRTLTRRSWRALPVAAAVWSSLPLVIGRSWRRRSPGPRLPGLDQLLDRQNHELRGGGL